MVTGRLICARCRRPLARATAVLAGMPLGPDCARAVVTELRETPLETVAVRTDRAAAQQFAQRQMALGLDHPPRITSNGGTINPASCCP